MGDVDQVKKQYRCLHCEYEFHMKVGAMIDHVACHTRDDYTKIYAIRAGKNEGGYRPEHHARCETNDGYFGGSDAALDHVLILESAYCEDGRVWCRYCEKKSWCYVDRTSRQLGVTVGYIRKHEEKCKARMTKSKAKSNKKK